jgi:acetate kinase
MKPANSSILTINGGSSSIKFALYQTGETLEQKLHGTVDRIGIRGMNLTANGEDNRRLDAAPELVTQELLEELRRISPYDPDHLPSEIELIEAFRQRHPKLPQVACFDTAFHRTMLRVAKLLPIPRRYDAKGVQRYGFHGLSYTYLMEELARSVDRILKEQK